MDLNVENENLCPPPKSGLEDSRKGLCAEFL